MKKKWTPHIIAVMALVVFIVLGLACASTSSSGDDSFTSTGICKTCLGKGYTETPAQIADGSIIYIKKQCRTCFGKGRI